MRLPFSPYSAQDVPQFAVARPQQMPQLPQVPQTTVGISGMMMGQTLQKLGDQIQRSASEIAGVLIQDKEQQRRERLREENLTLSEQVRDFSEGVLYDKTTGMLKQIDVDFTQVGSAKEIRDEYKALADQYVDGLIDEGKLWEGSELERRTRVSLREKALSQATAVASDNRTLIAQEKNRLAGEEANRVIFEQEKSFFEKVRAEEAAAIERGAKLTDQDYQKIFDQTFSNQTALTAEDRFGGIEPRLRAAAQLKVEQYAQNIINIGVQKWIADIAQESDRIAGDAANRIIFQTQQAFLEEVRRKEAIARESGTELTDQDYQDIYDRSFGSQVDPSAVDARFSEIPKRLRAAAQLKLEQFAQNIINTGIQKWTADTIQKQERQRQAVDSDLLQRETAHLETELAKTAEEYAKENPDEAPRAIIDRFLTNGEIDDAEIDKHIDERLQKTGSSFKDDANRIAMRTSLRGLISRVQGANSNAEVRDILNARSEEKKQRFDRSQQEIGDRITELVTEANYDGSLADGNLAEVDDLIQQQVNAAPKEYATELGLFLRNQFATARQSIIGSSVKIGFAQKESDASAALLDVIDNPETGFKAWATRAAANPAFTENASFAQWNDVFQMKRDELREKYSAKLDELFGDNKLQKEKYLREYDRQANGIDLAEDKKFLLQRQQTEKEQDLLNRRVGFTTSMDKLYLDLNNDGSMPTDKKSAMFEAQLESQVAIAKNGLTTVEQLKFDQYISSYVQNKRLEFQKDLNEQASSQLIATSAEQIDKIITGAKGEVWNNETFESKRDQITEIVTGLRDSGHLSGAEAIDQLSKSLRALDQNDAALLVAKDPEKALDLIKESPGGGKPGDRFYNLDVPDRLRFRNLAESAIQSGMSANQVSLRAGVGNALDRINPFNEGGSYLNEDLATFDLAAKTLPQAEAFDVELQREYLVSLGRAIEDGLDRIPEGGLREIEQYFVPIAFQGKEGYGRIDKLDPYYNQLRAEITRVREQRAADPAGVHWQSIEERLKESTQRGVATEKLQINYFDEAQQNAVLASQLWTDPEQARKETRVLSKDFIDQTREIWRDGVQSGTQRWNTNTFSSQQNQAVVRKQMAKEMLRSPIATRELVQAKVLTYSELQLYAEMGAGSLSIIDNGRRMGADVVNQTLMSSSGQTSIAAAKNKVSSDPEIAAIIGAYPYGDSRNSVTEMIYQHIAGQEMGTFKERLAAAKNAFSLGRAHIITNKDGDPSIGTARLPVSMSGDPDTVKSYAAILTNNANIRELAKGLTVIGNNLQEEKYAGLTPFVMEVLANTEDWRWSNFSIRAGQEMAGLTIMIRVTEGDRAGTYQPLTDQNGRPVFLSFDRLQQYQQIPVSQRATSFTEAPVTSLKRLGVIGSTEKLQSAISAGIRPTTQTNVQPVADFMRAAPGYVGEQVFGAAGVAAKGIMAAQQYSWEDLPQDFIDLLPTEIAADIANINFVDLAKDAGAAWRESTRAKWRNRLKD